MLSTDFFRKRENKKPKSILESQKWTKINVQNRLSQKSLGNPKIGFFFKLLKILIFLWVFIEK
jgi:hypothetical protein